MANYRTSQNNQQQNQQPLALLFLRAIPSVI